MTVHVLNGDAMVERFPIPDEQGSKVVWREILCEGPVRKDFDDAFFEARKNWLSTAFAHWEADMPDYDQEVNGELRKLEAVGPKDKVMLWFESDLFCQINLLGAVNYLIQLGVSPERIYQPVFGQPIYGFSDFSQESLLEAAENAVPIAPDDMEWAQKLWQAFTDDQPQKLVPFLDDKPATLPDMPSALALHCQRFPSLYDGLSLEERMMLELARKRRTTPYKQLMGSFFAATAELGFGDLQVQLILNRLSPTLMTFNGKPFPLPGIADPVAMEDAVAVTTQARMIMQRKSNWLNFTDFDRWLGGVHLTRERHMHFWDYKDRCFV